MSNKVHVVFKTARQIDGEYVFISAEKAFTDPERAEQFWRQQNASLWRETVAGVECECERAIHTVDLE